jgi:Xaa-Pro aminopeptidase
VRGFRRWISSRGLYEVARESGLLSGCSTAGFESHALSYAQYVALRRAFPGIRLRPTSDLIEDLALVKDPRELRFIARAASIADRVFHDVLPSISAGISEMDIAAEISWLTRTLGGEKEAFDVLVASGPRGAFPHARPTARRVKAGEFVTLDFGVIIGGYSSDLTRTVAVGRVPGRLRTAYRAVREAQEAALDLARGGICAKDLDAIARARIESFNLAKYFVHSLGHGIGLHVHERPRISDLSREVLRTGSVITIEPGIYIPRLGGVRIEDDVVLQDDGCRSLTNSPRELMVL